MEKWKIGLVIMVVAVIVVVIAVPPWKRVPLIKFSFTGPCTGPNSTRPLCNGSVDANRTLSTSFIQSLPTVELQRVGEEVPGNIDVSYIDVLATVTPEGSQTPGIVIEEKWGVGPSYWFYWLWFLDDPDRTHVYTVRLHYVDLTQGLEDEWEVEWVG